MIEDYKLDRTEWEEFLTTGYENCLNDLMFAEAKRHTMAALADKICLQVPRSYYTFGRIFLWKFPDAKDYLVAYSNLGTPAGVYNPNDDAILSRITDKDESISFILDRIEVE